MLKTIQHWNSGKDDLTITKAKVVDDKDLNDYYDNNNDNNNNDNNNDKNNDNETTKKTTRIFVRKNLSALSVRVGLEQKLACRRNLKKTPFYSVYIDLSFFICI